MSDLVARYETCLPMFLHDDGFSRSPLLALHHNDEITVATMAIPGDMIFRTAMTKFMTDLTAKEMIFGVDRFTRPGQRRIEALIQAGGGAMVMEAEQVILEARERAMRGQKPS